MDFTLRNMYTIIMTWGWLRGYDNGDFEDGDNADNFMGGGPLGILLYQMRYSGRCSVFYIELLLEDIDWEGGQNSNHIVVGIPTSGWVSNQWLEIHPWWVNFQPFTLVGLDAVVYNVHVGHTNYGNEIGLQESQILPFCLLLLCHTMQWSDNGIVET